MVLRASLFDVQQLNGHYEKSTVYGRQAGKWQLDLKGPYAVSWQSQLIEENVITITAVTERFVLVVTGYGPFVTVVIERLKQSRAVF